VNLRKENHSRAEASVLGLPRPAIDYLESPAASLGKLVAWLNASWQLRGCNQVGKWPRLTGRIHIRNLGRIVIGDRVQLLSHYARSILVTFPGGSLEIGDRAVLNYGVDIAATGLVRIGADSMIGTHTIILDNDFHELTDRDQVPESRPVMIGERVWIGNRCIIMPGVTIGDDAVVGAGSVVMTSIPSGAFAIGNPSRVIKRL
jgi:acetyltransferase-like isoleucine patch superfamily enzyme